MLQLLPRDIVMDKSDNLSLWNRHSHPHKDALKSFSRGGGFSGTAIDPMWMIREATSEWGPMGDTWGVRVVQENMWGGHKLKDGTVSQIHAILIELWYPVADGGRGVVQSYGQTTMVGENKYGSYTDEEAPKKEK